MSLDDARRTVAAWRAEGLTVALANGVFDLLHVGHLRYLEGAKRLADRLVVAVNSDASSATQFKFKIYNIFDLIYKQFC